MNPVLMLGAEGRSRPIRRHQSTTGGHLIAALPLAVFGMLLSMRGLDEVFNFPLSGVEIGVALAASSLPLGIFLSKGKILRQLRLKDLILCALPLMIGFIAAALWTFRNFGVGSADFRMMAAFMELGIVLVSLTYRTQWQSTLIYGKQGAFALGVVGITLLSLIGGRFSPSIQNYIFFSSDHRLRGFFEHPNQMAMVLSAMIPVLWCAQMVRWLRFGAIAAALLLIVLSGSKANIVLATVFPFVMFLSVAAVRKPLLFVVSTFSISLLLVNYHWIVSALTQLSYLLNPAYSEKVIDFIADPFSSKSLDDRQMLWSIAYKWGMDRPLFGMGWSSIQPMTGFDHVHNVWLNYFFAYGFFGLFIVFVLHLMLFRAMYVLREGQGWGRSSNRPLFGIWVGATSLLISTYSSDSMGPTTFMIFMVMNVLLFGGIGRANCVNRWQKNTPKAQNRSFSRPSVGRVMKV